MVQTDAEPTIAFYACYNGDPRDYGCVPSPYFFLKRTGHPPGSRYMYSDHFAWYDPNPDEDPDWTEEQWEEFHAAKKAAMQYVQNVVLRTWSDVLVRSV